MKTLGPNPLFVKKPGEYLLWTAPEQDQPWWPTTSQRQPRTTVFTSHTHHKLAEHDIQLLPGGHWQGGLHGLQGKVAVIAKPVGDLRMVATSEAAEDEGNASPASFPWGHRQAPPCPFLLATKSYRKREQQNAKKSTLSNWVQLY